MQRELADVAETLKTAKERQRRCTLLIGAGCSVKAGIPTAGGFMDTIKRDYPRAYGRAKEKTYAQCMAELTTSERRDLIASFVDEAKINWAHVCIAQLMKRDYVDRVLTTNFDPLVIRACALVGLFPAVYDFAASQVFSPGDLPHQAVFYLHGQRTGFVLINTDEEFARHSELLRPVFAEAGQGRVWLVVGYSGLNDPVFEHLAGVPRFGNGLYWVGFGDEAPPEHLSSRLLNAGKDAFYVSGFDADTFFIRLLQELGAFPPGFVGDPFLYLEDLLNSLVPFSLSRAGSAANPEIDVTERARAAIRAALDHQQERAEDLGGQAQDLLLAGDYESLVALRPEFDPAQTPELASPLAWGFVMQGNEIYDLALEADEHERDDRFAASVAKYEEALAIERDNADALNGLGNALSEQAKTAAPDDAARLYARSNEAYSRALELDPTDDAVLKNWSIALWDQARTTAGEEASGLYALAAEKAEAAIALDPDDPAAFLSLGNALSDQAKTAAPDDADQLFARAHEAYARGADLDPTDGSILKNWSIALLDQARATSGEEAGRLCALAAEKAEAALVVDPTNQGAFHALGDALSDAAELASGPTADRLYARSYEAYERASDLDPADATPVQNWAISLLAHAHSKSGAEAQRLYALSAEKAAESVALDPGNPRTRSTLADALSWQARGSSGETAEKLFSLAGEAYRAVLEHEPDDADALSNWGSMLVAQATTKPEGEVAPILAAARERLKRAESIQPGSGAYDLACASALEGKLDECRRWLKVAETHGRIDPAHAVADPDLAGVRDEAWFRDLIARVEGQANAPA